MVSAVEPRPSLAIGYAASTAPPRARVPGKPNWAWNAWRRLLTDASLLLPLVHYLRSIVTFSSLPVNRNGTFAA